MADNEATEVAQEPQQEEQEFSVKIEDAGPGTKKVLVEIPQERISAELEKQFKELRQQASIPGFRTGHAPQKLIEKRFSADVKEQVRRSLISESYGQAVEKNKLQVIGEPEFVDPDAIKIPDEGPLSYSFTVEVQPDFTLPDLANFKVKKPRVQITDENVDQAMQNLREQQGALVPVEDRGMEARDFLFADVHVKVDGEIVAHQHNAQLVSRPGRIAGIQIDDLDKQLAGMKPDETRTIHAHALDTHSDERIRGRAVQIDIALKDIKRMELAEITPQFLDELGFSSEQELRDALRAEMEQKIASDIQQAMRDQVYKYLLDNTQLELPARLSEKQTDRIIGRKAVELRLRGLPSEQVEANIERLRHGARDEAARELKLFFILQKLADQQKVDVTEAELNGRIAMMAVQSEKRPEKLKQEMAKDGSLANLYIQMREQKAVDQLLGSAQIEEIEIEPETK